MSVPIGVTQFQSNLSDFELPAVMYATYYACRLIHQLPHQYICHFVRYQPPYKNLLQSLLLCFSSTVLLDVDFSLPLFPLPSGPTMYYYFVLFFIYPVLSMFSFNSSDIGGIPAQRHSSNCHWRIVCIFLWTLVR